MFALYLAGFTTYSWTMGDIQRTLLHQPFQMVLFYAAGVGALVGLAKLERRELGVDDMLIYEDEPDPIVRSLEIG
jgi:hypothetical protein